LIEELSNGRYLKRGESDLLLSPFKEPLDIFGAMFALQKRALLTSFNDVMLRLSEEDIRPNE
jgi:hypothetical protein